MVFGSPVMSGILDSVSKSPWKVWVNHYRFLCGKNWRDDVYIYDGAARSFLERIRLPFQSLGSGSGKYLRSGNTTKKLWFSIIRMLILACCSPAFDFFKLWKSSNTSTGCLSILSLRIQRSIGHYPKSLRSRNSGLPSSFIAYYSNYVFDV